MKKSILDKMRKLNWVLSESTTGSLSYNDLSKILCEIVGANVLITNIDGNVLGAGYANVEDASTVSDEQGSETVCKILPGRSSRSRTGQAGQNTVTG